MKKLILIFLLSASSGFAKVPEILEKIEAKLKTQKAFEVRFVQKLKTKRSTEERSGIISVEIPNRFRSETLKPNKSLIVSNGKKTSIFQPSEEEGIPNQLAVISSSTLTDWSRTLLSGQFSALHKDNIEKLDNRRFRITPVGSKAGSIKFIEVAINLDRLEIEEIDIIQKLGNQSNLVLSNYQWVTSFPKGFFDFIPPKNTELTNADIF